MVLRSIVIACLVFNSGLYGYTDQNEKPQSPHSEIVLPDAKFELLYTRAEPGLGGLTEGPAVAPDGSIYFTDIRRGSNVGKILRFDPKTRQTSVFASKSAKANGLMFDADGHLVACEGADNGGRRVSRWNLETRDCATLADRYKGKRFNSPNDLCIDLKGRVYFTDPRYLGDEPRELEHRAVYRIDRDGTVVEVTHNVEKPNGIAISPDQRTLYVADHNNGTDDIKDGANPTPGAMKIYAFPLDESGLVSGQRRTLVDYGKEAGCDGMTLDVHGNIYLTARRPSHPGIHVINPDGKEKAFIPTAAKGFPSNCVFGIGSESNVLYVTIEKSLYRISLKAEGFNLHGLALLKRFRDEFVAIKPGEDGFPESFVRGNDAGAASERPATTVSIDYDFSINAYEIPQNLWTAVMGSNPSRWKGPRNSVEMLSFTEAQQFCQAATVRMRVAGLVGPDEVVRLPSETEWEYCARAGTPTLYSFGDDIADLDDHGWYTGNAKGNDPPVGAKKPNRWKLYDVHGYLWEWCADPWHDNYVDAPKNGSVWSTSGDQAHGVLRGGSWKDKADRLQSATRVKAPRSLRDDAVGLRCVLARG